MYTSEKLRSILDNASAIRSQATVIAEWNMNVATNIEAIGNYRFRPLAGVLDKYGQVPNSFDPSDVGRFYTDATDADSVVDGGIDDETDQPMTFISVREKERLLFSLEECFGRFRPRSGINKLRNEIGSGYLHHSNENIFQRPRYYMADKEDKFKYWTSYRTENGVERGISNQIGDGRFFIDDASPFVVYKDPIPANRIVLKVQTHSGDIDLGPFSSSNGPFSDPFYGEQNKAVPKIWRLQYLTGDSWIDAISFNGSETRRDGSPIFGSDGYLELEYGLLVPEKYRMGFRLVKELSSTTTLPISAIPNTGYLIKESSTDRGYIAVFDEDTQSWESFVVSYGWALKDDSYESIGFNFARELTDISIYDTGTSSGLAAREFSVIRGLRLVVETMNKLDATLDLIELSPRLAVDLSDKVTQVSVKKSASDLGVSGLPVSQLLAGVGSLELFDHDLAFSDSNSASIISKYVNQNIQIKIYETIFSEDGQIFNVPIKTMYSEGFPEIDNASRVCTIEMRDLFFYFESLNAPQILVQNASLSYAVSLLLDSIGFSNYIYKRNPGEGEEIIPFFFVPPETSLAEALESLAIASQSAMFFDEFNNFVVMSRNYMLPDDGERAVDLELTGSVDSRKNGPYRNERNPGALSNIIEVASQENNVYNDGVINYTSRYIQRSYGSLEQSQKLDREKTWSYKPALLWEVTANENVRSINEESATQSAYGLSALPLNSDLSDTPPEVVNNEIVNNIMDFGESIYWLSRHSGYFYANGEIIRFDAIEYSVSSLLNQLGVPAQGGNVWVSSNQEYQSYFSRLAFNGKMYPTGRVRIYAEPNYEFINGELRLSAGPVAKHGRGQFGTKIVSHTAGLNQYWEDNQFIRGCQMDSSMLFGKTELPATQVGPAGVNNAFATKSSRTSLIKNFETLVFDNETGGYELAQNVQASALVFNGPQFEAGQSPIDFISYIYKRLGEDNSDSTPFKYFGTRMRIIGRVEAGTDNVQSASGSMPFYSVQSPGPDSDGLITGGSGGIGVLVNQKTNNGYFFEVIALSKDNLDEYADSGDVANIVFYKIVQSPSDPATAVPVKLWSGIAPVTVDSGTFAAQQNIVAEDKSTVLDLAVEYEELSGSRKRFFLYLNNTQIATVVDDEALPSYPNVSLFVRGSSHCMFENLYALENNYSLNSGYQLETVANSVFGQNEITSSDALRKYSISGIIQDTYLSGLSPNEPPQYNIYFEEFGTIMREAAYFDIKYDKAYPALYSKISPTPNKNKSYVVSGYLPQSYGAEFLVFNTSDSFIILDETTGNYLRIQGITFTQSSESSLSVDDYFSKNSDFSQVTFTSDTDIYSIQRVKENYRDIKLNRITYGKNEFSISSPYIQSQDAAASLMKWLTTKIMKPRKSIGLKIFSDPTIQLGDIVTIRHVDADGIQRTVPEDKRFVVYYIEYERSIDGPDMTIYVSEV